MYNMYKLDKTYVNKSNWFVAYCALLDNSKCWNGGFSSGDLAFKFTEGKVRIAITGPDFKKSWDKLFFESHPAWSKDIPYSMVYQLKKAWNNA